MTEGKTHAKKHTTSHAKKTHSGSEDTITVTKTGLWQGVSGVLALLLIVSIFTGGFSGASAPEAQAGAGNQPTAVAPSNNGDSGNQPTIAPIDMDTLADDDAFKGDENAPVTIVEFSDFECPFCARFYSDTLSQIEENYINTGKVKLVYRDFPLSFHPNAQKAGEAAECAGDQGEYWAMHDIMFERGVSGGVATFKAYAAEIGLDQATFDSCLDNGDNAGEVQQDFLDGQAAGVTGTPGFVINGQVVAGAQPYAVFEQVIEAALNG